MYYAMYVHVDVALTLCCVNATGLIVVPFRGSNPFHSYLQTLWSFSGLHQVILCLYKGPIPVHIGK